MSETNITKEAADTLLREWAEQNRPVLLQVLQGETMALSTCWEGTLKVECAGMFRHTSGHTSGQTINLITIGEFPEIALEDADKGLFLRLWRGPGPAPCGIVLATTKTGDLGELPLVTDWLQ